jgi:hypothetical protein
MEITVIANDAGEIVGAVLPSRMPLGVAITGEAPVLGEVESMDGDVVLKVNAPQELVDLKPGTEPIEILRRFVVKEGRLVRRDETELT